MTGASELSESVLASGENVFIVSAADGVFEVSVASPVDLSEHDGPTELGDGDRRLAGLSGSRGAQTLESMEPGDLLLFYGGGGFVGVGTVGTTYEDEDGWVSETFWGGEELPYVFTVESFEAVDVPAGAVNRIFDYNESYSPATPMRVADSRVSKSPRVIHLAVKRFAERNN